MNQNKMPIIISLVVAVLVIGGAVFAIKSKSSSTTSPNNSMSGSASKVDFNPTPLYKPDFTTLAWAESTVSSPTISDYQYVKVDGKEILLKGKVNKVTVDEKQIPQDKLYKVIDYYNQDLVSRGWLPTVTEGGKTYDADRKVSVRDTHMGYLKVKDGSLKVMKLIFRNNGPFGVFSGIEAPTCPCTYTYEIFESDAVALKDLK